MNTSQGHPGKRPRRRREGGLCDLTCSAHHRAEAEAASHKCESRLQPQAFQLAPTLTLNLPSPQCSHHLPQKLKEQRRWLGIPFHLSP